MRVKQWHKKFDGVCHDLQPVYYRKEKTFLRIEDVWYCEECDKMVDMQYDAVEPGRKILMSKWHTSMSERLHRVESKGERRGLDRAKVVEKNHTAADLGSVTAVPGARLSSEIGLERLASEPVASPSPVPVPNPAGSVAAAAPGASLCSEVEPLASELGASPLTEAPDVVASPSKKKYPGRPGDRYPGTARGAPCPCGSGERYKRCCGKGAPPVFVQW